MHWELWDRQSANLVEEFDSEEEALRGVRDMLAVNTPDLIDEISVGAMYDEGEPRDVELPPSLYGEALKSRLAEMAQEDVAETAHKVHARIRKWLAEEGWAVDDVDDPLAIFNVMVTLGNGQKVNLFQRREHHDHITISQRWMFEEAFQSDFSKIPESKQFEIVCDIRLGMIQAGLEFEGFSSPPAEMRYAAYAYFDGLTKDVLMQRILLVIRAYWLVIWTITRGSAETDLPMEEPARHLRLVS